MLKPVDLPKFEIAKRGLHSCVALSQYLPSVNPGGCVSVSAEDPSSQTFSGNQVTCDGKDSLPATLQLFPQ